MYYKILENTQGQKIIWNATAPSGKIGGYSLLAGDIWVNTTTYGIQVYNGSAWSQEGETATGVYRFSYDTTDYVTLTITDSGTATFAHTSGGTAEFIFSNQLSVGQFSSVTAGSGISFATYTAAARVYADDGGAARTGDRRAFLARTLLTVDHPGDFSTHGAVGQLKLKDLVDLTNGFSAGVRGYLELAGTNNFGATSYVSGVEGVVELTTASTITAGGLLAGVMSVWKSNATATGVYAAFAAINHPNNTGKWAYGLYAKASGVACGLLIGDFASATAGSGIVLSAAVTAAARIYADDGGAKLAAGEKRVSISRFLYATSDTDNTDQTLSGHVGHVKVANDLTIGGNLAGLCGYLEGAGTKTLIGGVGSAVAAGVWGRVDMPANFVMGTNARISAFAASGNLGGTHTGKAAVLHVPNPSAGAWDFFLALGTASGCHAAGDLHKSDGNDELCDAYLKVDINGTAYYIPLFDTLAT